jgi:hypothetical protein
MSSDADSVASAISDDEPVAGTNGDIGSGSDLEDDLFGDGDGDDEPIQPPFVLRLESHFHKYMLISPK